MKKWILIGIIGVVALWYLLSGKPHELDKCLKNRKGCVFTGAKKENFIDEDFLNGSTIIAAIGKKKYPFSSRKKQELKQANLYFDVSMGLQPGVDKFVPFIKALGDYMGESKIKIFKSSFQGSNGKISDAPIEMKNSLDEIVTLMQNRETYAANYSHLEGTVKTIVSNPDEMSVFFTDFLIDIKGTINSKINGKNSSCKVCNEGFSWATQYFTEWFKNGGQIIVATQKASVNQIPNGNAYALMFIPQGRKIDQLLGSLKDSGISEDQIAVFNPLGLDLNLATLDKFEKLDDRGITVVDKGPGYLIISSENNKLSSTIEDFGQALSLNLNDETGYSADWKLTVMPAVDFFEELELKQDPKSEQVHKNLRLQGKSPVLVTSDSDKLLLKLETVENTGKSDLIFKKYTVKISGEVDLDSRKTNFQSPVKTMQGVTINSCLYHALNKSLNVGGDSVHDKIYDQEIFYTIYSIVNVPSNK